MRNDFLRALHRILHRARLGDALDQVRARGDQVGHEPEVIARVVQADTFKRPGPTPAPVSSAGSLPKKSPSPASQPAPRFSSTKVVRHYLTREQEDLMTAVWFVVCVLLVAIIAWRLP